MGKLGFLAGMAAGYVLGARAGKQRYAQIKTVSGKVWNSAPVQKQVATAKEAAKTKAAPVVADLVGDAAKQAAERLRAQRTVTSEVTTPTRQSASSDAWVTPPAGPDPWAQATRP
jgi:oxygen-dependent protoporphyrinogen oxidase